MTGERRRGNLDAETHTIGKTSYEDKGRGQSDTSIHQGIPKIANKATEATKETRRFFLTYFTRKQPFQNLNLGLPASWTVRQCIPVVKVTQCVVLCYSSSSQLRQSPFWLYVPFIGKPFISLDSIIYSLSYVEVSIFIILL